MSDRVLVQSRHAAAESGSETIQRRRVQEEFIARGLRSREDAQRTGIYHSAESVHSELQRRLDARRKSVLGWRRGVYSLEEAATFETLRSEGMLALAVADEPVEPGAPSVQRANPAR